MEDACSNAEEIERERGDEEEEEGRYGGERRQMREGEIKGGFSLYFECFGKIR